jgi:transposase
VLLGHKERLFDPIDGLTLDDLVPADHFYRHLERSLDLSFVRDLVAACYAPAGRPSIDPVVFFKLQLVLFFEGIRSERQLLALAADRLSVRWYLGYDLDETLPDHSSLTRIRDRYGIDIFRRFFEHIVAQCQQARLVWGRELYIDATKVEANADIDSLVPRFAVETHLRHLFTESQAQMETAIDTPTPIPLPAGVSELDEPMHTRHDWLAALGRPDRAIVSGPYQRTSDFRVSTTDPDASPMRTGDGCTRLGYQDHYVVDGGRARIILGVLVAPAEVQENQPALDLVWRARFRWHLHLRQVTGDTKYGSAENIVALEDQHVRAYVPLSAAGHKPGRFADTDFHYDPVTDAYQCPGNVTLTFLSTCQRTRRRIYEAPAAACRCCSLREQCTTSRRGRRVGRRFDEDYLDRVRGYQATEPYQKALRKRQVWVEPLFAEAKQWHGLERFRLRGLPKVNTEALLIATGQNLKRFLSRHGWGRRPFPSGAAGIRSGTCL